MKKHTHFGTLFVLLAFIFMFLYGIGPSYVDEAGALHEWFGFVVLAYLSLFIGVLVYITKFLSRK